MAPRSKKYATITNEQIVAAKDRLAADHFAVLCAAAQGASYGAMAANMGLNVGTVKSRLNRAREVMLRILPEAEQC